MSLYSPINNSLAGASRDARKQEASKIKIASGLFILPVIGLCGCVSMASLANSPVVINQLKIRSAGFTGCSTEENDISNINPNPDGSGTWNATCKGKVYLCSQGSSEGHASTYSCAASVN
jgi:hypothetical protein